MYLILAVLNLIKKNMHLQELPNPNYDYRMPSFLHVYVVAYIKLLFIRDIFILYIFIKLLLHVYFYTDWVNANSSLAKGFKNMTL